MDRIQHHQSWRIGWKPFIEKKANSSLRALITGDAGFIGFHVAQALIERGDEVMGIDGLTDYYDPALKAARLRILHQSKRFCHITTMLEDLPTHAAAIRKFAPEVLLHFAAQAGVRYSIENPDAYVSANVEGTLRVLELARELRVRHLMIASTSSVYGGNTKMPFAETDTVATPVSLYAATKLATEALAHSFSHLWQVPTTCFRFFTVYGPYGRPDMALFKFVSAIRSGHTIDVYGRGEMKRDFTYVGDLANSILKLLEVAPAMGEPVSENDSLSSVAPYRIVNIAGGNPVGLLDFIASVEKATGLAATKNLLPMQPGDVVATWADPTLLSELIGPIEPTDLRDGVERFVNWYDEYQMSLSSTRPAL